MTTREALIAAIAAAPDDDLPRLVAADWFDENGQSERAEFIRLQISSWRHDDSENFQTQAEKLLLNRFGDWFGPMLSAFDTSRPESDYVFIPDAKSVKFSPRLPPSPPDDFVLGGTIQRGFVGEVSLNLGVLPDRTRIDIALREEPIDTLSFPPSMFHTWSRFTAPELRRVRSLRIGVQPLSAIESVFNDPHLEGVRTLSLWNRPLSGNLVIGLVNSPLGRQLTELSAPLDDYALRTLADGYTAALRRLTLDGWAPCRLTG